MARFLMVFTVVALFGAGLVGCRAEVDTDTASNVTSPR